MTHMRMTHFLAMMFAVLSTTAVAAGPAYRLEVDGLACPFCAYGIEKQLNALPGVEEVQTDIGDGAVIVRMQEAGELDESMAEEAVRDAGFTLRSFTLMPSGAEAGDPSREN